MDLLIVRHGIAEDRETFPRDREHAHQVGVAGRDRPLDGNAPRLLPTLELPTRTALPLDRLQELTEDQLGLEPVPLLPGWR
jgi:hypothetical protein